MRTGAVPAPVVVLAEAAGLSLIVIFVGRLTVLDPRSGLLRPLTAVSGFVLNPALLVAFAFGLFRPISSPASAETSAPLMPVA